jgi:hypothetical protein
MPHVTPVKALYCRRIQFESTGWLRAALLYWEGVLRFVPDGLAPIDPPEVHDLVTAGLVENVSPNRYRKAAAEALKARLDDVLRVAPQRLPCLTGTGDPLIYASMLDPELLQLLQERGQAATAGEWARMAPDLATLYKTILANIAGRELNAAPATDESECDVSEYLDYRTLVRGTGQSAPVDGFACARPLEPFRTVEAANSLSAETLLTIRREYSAPRRIFRDTVQARVAPIADLPSKDAIHAHVRDMRTEIEGEVEAQRGALRQSNTRDTWKFLLIGAPASIGTAVAVAGAAPMAAALGLFGSVGIGAADLLMHQRQRRRAGPYLLSLEGALRARRRAAAPSRTARVQ